MNAKTLTPQGPKGAGRHTTHVRSFVRLQGQWGGYTQVCDMQEKQIQFLNINSTRLLSTYYLLDAENVEAEKLPWATLPAVESWVYMDKMQGLQEKER